MASEASSFNNNANISASSGSNEQLVEKLLTKSQKLKFVSEEQPKISKIKENGELMKKISELEHELDEQKDKIIAATSTSQTVKKNIESLIAAMEECLEYFDELNNTTVMFVTKPKLKRKALAITQSLRAKSTQLLTSVTLELLLSQATPDKAPEPVRVPAGGEEESLQGAPEYVLLFYGLCGRPVNYARCFELAMTAATTDNSPRAMTMVAKCLSSGLGTGAGADPDLSQAQLWLEKASERGFVEAKVDLAVLLLKSMRNRRESCVRKLSESQSRQQGPGSKPKPSPSMALVAMTAMSAEKDRKEDDKLLEKATELLIEAADQDYAQADTLLGILSEESDDFAEAARFYSAGTRRGCPDSANRLGLLHYFGRGVAQSDEKAFALFSSAAQAGNRDAFNNVGTCFERGTGVEASMSEAFRYYEMGAPLGCAEAMYSLGYMCLKRYILIMQSVSDGTGRIGMGMGAGRPFTPYTPMNTQPTPFTSTPNLSMRPFTPQHPHMQLQLQHPGSLPETSYYDGEGGATPSSAMTIGSAMGGPIRFSSKDKEELARTARQGIRWLRRAAELGITEAAYQLGRTYQQGIGTPVDMSAAFMQFETSAWSGHAAAAELAGDMKYSGNGTCQDLVAAAQLYHIAAQKGRGKAQNALGVLMETGQGVLDQQPQPVEACKWFFEAVFPTIVSKEGNTKGTVPASYGSGAASEAAVNLALLLSKHPSLASFRSAGGDVVSRGQVIALLSEHVTVTAKHSAQFDKALKTLLSQHQLVMAPPPPVSPWADEQHELTLSRASSSRPPIPREESFSKQDNSDLSSNFNVSTVSQNDASVTTKSMSLQSTGNSNYGPPRNSGSRSGGVNIGFNSGSRDADNGSSGGVSDGQLVLELTD